MVGLKCRHVTKDEVINSNISKIYGVIEMIKKRSSSQVIFQLGISYKKYFVENNINNKIRMLEIITE